MNIIDFFGIVILMCGVILIYDARPITKKVFSFGDQNDGVKGLKIVGRCVWIAAGIACLNTFLSTKIIFEHQVIDNEEKENKGE